MLQWIYLHFCTSPKRPWRHSIFSIKQTANKKKKFRPQKPSKTNKTKMGLKLKQESQNCHTYLTTSTLGTQQKGERLIRTQVFSSPHFHVHIVLAKLIKPALLYHKQSACNHWCPGKILECKAVRVQPQHRLPTGHGHLMHRLLIIINMHHLLIVYICITS